MELRRFSSRAQRLDEAFLADRLRGARRYLRIAGYFRSSIFELVGEEIEGVDEVRIVCNSELDPADIAISRHVRETALKERWNQATPEVEALLHRERYRRLHDLLRSGRVEVRVVARDLTFVHGKAGVIEGRDGTKTAFLGSVNETKSAFAGNYEILWEDTSPEGVAWVEEEFEALWAEGHPLPDAIVEEVARIAEREEVAVETVAPADLPAAALAEAPIYRGGEQLQPWQRSFVAMFLEHRETYGCARLLLADEVGVGKTLSLAGSAVVSSLLGDGPVLILCPSTLTLQWQTELLDKLGVPTAVWHSNKKVWLDPHGHVVKTRGAEDVSRCPFQIAIVSTGLVFQLTQERQELLKRRYGTVVLDEAHKARRRGGLGAKGLEPNNLLDFMLKIGPKTKHLLLGTATPIQTEVYELWDLLKVLNTGVEFVLGRDWLSAWVDWEQALPRVKGAECPETTKEAWEWLRSPLPPSGEHALFLQLRQSLELTDRQFFSDRPFTELPYARQQGLQAALDGQFFQHHNPVVRHTVLRKRATLEEAGLLERVGVEVHPQLDRVYPGVPFDGQGLLTTSFFDAAYRATEGFTGELGKRQKGVGFLRSLLLQRVCSSFAAGLSTVRKMLARETVDEDDEEAIHLAEVSSGMTSEELRFLHTVIEELSRPEAVDPKFAAVRSFLTEQRSEGKTWLEHGCIVFSQYYDTALWLATELAQTLEGEPIAVYAGLGKSRLLRGAESTTVEREHIKAAVKSRDIRLVIATDAACEGLNLQTLGTLINVDLPWNPSRLEQRLGRIKRFGQVRRQVDMLNLVYRDTRDQVVYQALSRRLRDSFDLFGSLPDTIEDDWIESKERLNEELDRYIDLRNQARNSFEIRYSASIDPAAHRWETCSRVLSRQDVVERLSRAW